MKLAIVCDSLVHGEFVAEHARKTGFEVFVVDLCEENIDLKNSDAVLNIATNATAYDLRKVTDAIAASGIRRFVTSPVGFMESVEPESNPSDAPTFAKKIFLKLFARKSKSRNVDCDWTVIPDIDFVDFDSQCEKSNRLAKSLISEITSDRNIGVVLSRI
jgi:hypothetical protein